MIKMDWNVFKVKFLGNRVCYINLGFYYIVYVRVGIILVYCELRDSNEITDFENNYKSGYTNVENIVDEFVTINYLFNKVENEDKIYYNGKVGINCIPDNVADLQVDGLVEIKERSSVSVLKKGLLWFDGNNLRLCNGSSWKILGGGLKFKGSWDASSNSPDLINYVGDDGDFFIVSVAGNTNLNGITDWEIYDWVVYSSNGWHKIDNSDKVVSVNGKVGSVVLNKTDIGLGNVLNEKQLIAGGNDFNNFNEKTNLNKNDIFLIEDSESSFNKKRVRYDNVIRKKIYSVLNNEYYTNSSTFVLLFSINLTFSKVGDNIMYLNYKYRIDRARNFVIQFRDKDGRVLDENDTNSNIVNKNINYNINKVVKIYNLNERIDCYANITNAILYIRDINIFFEGIE